jgi:pilus assembly protein Flp/PilA
MNLRTLFTFLHQDESGQDLIEYALVCALIALGAISGMQTVANAINSAFDKIGSEIGSATTANPGS